MSDIFKDMQAEIGCQYISDLPYHKREVWCKLRRMILTDYTTEQLEDFARYVFGVRYSILKDVMAHLEEEPDFATR